MPGGRDSDANRIRARCRPPSFPASAPCRPAAPGHAGPRDRRGHLPAHPGRGRCRADNGALRPAATPAGDGGWPGIRRWGCRAGVAGGAKITSAPGLSAAGVPDGIAMAAQAVVGHLAQGLAAIAAVCVARGLAGDGVLLAHSLARPTGTYIGRARPAGGRSRMPDSCRPHGLPLRSNRSSPFLPASGGARRRLETGVAGSINALVHPMPCGCRARPCPWSRRLRRGDYRHRLGGPRYLLHKRTPGG